MPKVKMLSVNIVAEKLGLNPYTVRAMLRDGRELKGYKIGKRWKVKSTDLDSYMRSRSNKS